jgi:DNA-binding SARP family transcriptional activator
VADIEAVLRVAPPDPRRNSLRIGALSSAAVLELGNGRPDLVVEWLEPLQDLARLRTDNPATVMWEGDWAEALIALGRVEEAADVVADLERRARASGNRRGIGAVERLQGSLATDEEMHALFDSSREHYRATGHVFGAARTDLEWGRRLAAAGQVTNAVALLQRALDGFEAVWALPWAARAAQEIEAQGGTPRRRLAEVAGLDGEHLQVAVLAVAGLSSEEVAARLGLPRGRAAQLLGGVADAVRAASVTEAPAHLRAPNVVRGRNVAPDVIAREPSTVAPVEPSSTVTRIELFGRFRVVVGGADRTPPPGLGATLVKVLAVQPGGAATVDAVIEHLWPESDAERGRARLRNVLSRLRTQVDGVVERDGDVLRLGDDVDVDLHRFERAAEAALVPTTGVTSLERAIGLHAGPLLPDAPYDPWAAPPRERARRRLLELLGVLAARHRDAGRVDAAVAALERAIAVEPYDEEHYLSAARLRRDQGRAAAALGFLVRAEEMLRELGLPPSDRIRDLRSSL